MRRPLRVCFFLLMIDVSSAHRVSAQSTVQNVEQLKQIVTYAEKLHHRPFEITADEASAFGGKCGLSLSFQIVQNWDAFPERQKLQIAQVQAETAMQKSRIVGHFRISYDTTGTHEPALLDSAFDRIPNSVEEYIDSVGAFFNRSWSYEIDSLGYNAPPLRVGQTYYDVYVKEFGQQVYGFTQFTSADIVNPSENPPRYYSYVELDNDYQGYFSRGMAGLQVTAAHEFHHAIQLGSYGYRSDELYFYEITSTWMEDVVFNDVNDYYQYLKVSPTQPHSSGHFANPDVSFTVANGFIEYSRAIWGKFIEKRFSRNVMQQTWEFVRTESTVSAINHALQDVGSSFREAFIEWGVWNDYTAQRSDPVNYYTEGHQYPPMTLRAPIQYANAPRSFIDSIETISSIYRPVCLLANPDDNCATSPQMLVIVSNLNTSGSRQRVNFRYDIAPSGDATFKSLSNGIYVRLNVPDPQNWSSYESVPSVVADIVVYPNPFNPNGNKPLNFRFPSVTEETARLAIFCSSMDRIISKEVPISSMTFEPKIQWDGHDENGNLVSSGVYVYIITMADREYNGKFAVVRE